jgi:hypothetical protein
MHTLYQLADAEIRSCIDDYLALASATNGFTNVTETAIDTDRKAVIVLSGLNAAIDEVSPGAVVREWERRKAIPLDVEAGITAGVYTNLRGAGVQYLEEIKAGTNGFRTWAPEFISANPHTLPLLQHLAGIFSKAALAKQVGSVSDNRISAPAARRIAAVLEARVQPTRFAKGSS